MKNLLLVVLVIAAISCAVRSVFAFGDDQIVGALWNGGYAIFLIWLAYDRFKKP
jgi:hypothetical protein